MSIEHVEPRRFLLEPDAALEHECAEPRLGFLRERRRCVEPAADLRRVDAEQPDTADVRETSMVLPSMTVRTSSGSDRRGRLKDFEGGNSADEQSTQNLHARSLLQ